MTPDDPDGQAALPSQLAAERHRAEALNAELRQVYAQNAKLTRRLKRTRLLALILGAPVLLLAAPILVPAYLVIRRRRWQVTRNRHQPTFAARNRPAKPFVDPAHEAAMAARPDTFALVRVIGNDLIPRHARGQSATNLRFILETEPDLADCTKHWVVNRIVDPDQEREILALLEAHGQDYIRLPFDWDIYAGIGYDHDVFPYPGYFVGPELSQLDASQQARARIQYSRLRNNYLINNNGARNAALELGQRAAKWALPWDGNCFVSQSAWERIRADIAAAPEARYFSVPMIRLASNADALADHAADAATEEPQILFRSDAEQRFDERHPYGRRPKVELLARLAVDGPWRKWACDPWDMAAGPVVPDAHRTGRAGHVARLYSGRGDLEKAETTAHAARGLSRSSSILTVLHRLDWQLLHARGYDPRAPALFDPAAIERVGSDPGHWLAGRIAADADAVRDSEAGRQQLGQVFRDVTSLALAWRMTGDTAARDHATDLVGAMVIAGATRVSPTRPIEQAGGETGDTVSAAADLPGFLDAVRFLDDPALSREVSSWLREHLTWLLTGAQGRRDRTSADHRGIYHDLRVVAIAAFLGDGPTMLSTFEDSQDRLGQHFAADGRQPQALNRARSAHDCLVTLQGWATLYTMFQRIGFRPLALPEAAHLDRGLAWLLGHRGTAWPFKQIEPVDTDRFAPLNLFAAGAGLGGAGPVDDDAAAMARKARFHPECGIPIYWPLMHASALPAGA